MMRWIFLLLFLFYGIYTSATDLEGMEGEVLSMHKENINTTSEIGVKYTTVMYYSQKKYELENFSPAILQRIEDAEGRLYQKPQPKPEPFYTYDHSTESGSYYIFSMLLIVGFIFGAIVVWKVGKKIYLRKRKKIDIPRLTEEMIVLQCKMLLDKGYSKQDVEHVYNRLQKEKIK